MNSIITAWTYAAPVLSIVGSIVIAASIFVARTPTPAPGSRWATVYRGIELAALVFGQAKERGLLPPEPAVDSAAQRVVDEIAPQAPSRA
jgi:hypothetical protein